VRFEGGCTGTMSLRCTEPLRCTACGALEKDEQDAIIAEVPCAGCGALLLRARACLPSLAGHARRLYADEEPHHLCRVPQCELQCK
jgi:hypothetical protein